MLSLFSKPARSKRLKTTTWMVFVGIILLIIWRILPKISFGDKGESDSPILVTTITASAKTLPRTLNFFGRVVNQNEIPIYIDLPKGRVERVLVDRGQFVKKGDLLAVLNSDELQIQKKQQLAHISRAVANLSQQATQVKEIGLQLQQIKKESERSDAVLDLGLVSEETKEQKNTALAVAKIKLQSAKDLQAIAKAEVEIAEAQLSVVELQLKQTDIRAPTDGYLIERNIQQGGLLPVDKPLFSILSGQNLEVELDVPASEAQLLKSDMEVVLVAKEKLLADKAEVHDRESVIKIDPAENTLRQKLQDWKKAWEEKDIQRYLAYYADSFTSGEQTFAGWKKKRQYNLSQIKDIQITLSQIKVSVGKDRAIAEFLQHYKSPTINDTIKKRMIWVFKQGDWLINKESMVNRFILPEFQSKDLVSTQGQVRQHAPLLGHISHIATKVDSQTQTAKVNVRFDVSPAMLLGQVVETKITLQMPFAIYIPKTALQFIQDRAYVFVVDKNYARLRSVKTGVIIDDSVEIREGIQANEQVVDSAGNFLKEGMQIKLAKTVSDRK